MSKKNDDFFREKKPWSEVKDELLGCYLRPYIQKVLNTGKPIVYVDCFAGKGIFEDGKPGSPLIALHVIADCLVHTKMSQCDIQPFFIDLNYADDLRRNLKDYCDIEIVPGRYEDNIERLLANKAGCNVFLYVDPYGIKALDCRLFDSFSRKFGSIELLINMNSFGFIREACRVLGAPFGDESLLDDLVEYDSTRLEAGDKSQKALDEIAGGDYWKEIIERYRQGEMTVFDAEAQFAARYCERLCKSYTYVLNMPLRIRRGQLPKYRMIHATNHAEGCLLMVDNICGRWELLRNIQNNGQLQLWEENYENEVVGEGDIRDKVIAHLSEHARSSFVRLNTILAEFFTSYGPICSTGAAKNTLRELEARHLLDIRRQPPSTPTGRPSRFLADEKKKTTEIRWLS